MTPSYLGVTSDTNRFRQHVLYAAQASRIEKFYQHFIFNESNIEKKVEAATSLVYSSCYDIGLVYAYADTKHFNSVAVAIRRVLKAAGLDYMADSVWVVHVMAHPASLGHDYLVIIT